MPDLKINKLEDTTNWNYLKHKEKKKTQNPENVSPKHV